MESRLWVRFTNNAFAVSTVSVAIIASGKSMKHTVVILIKLLGMELKVTLEMNT
jgi:hypothetical protein